MKRGRVRFVEGVPYHAFVVSYLLTTGQRRRMVRWSPGYPWVEGEMARELVARFGLEGIVAGSVRIRSLAARGPRKERTQ